MSIPSSAKQWNVQGKTGFDSLKLSEQPLPPLGDSQVLVKIRGASINFRDLLITRGRYPFPQVENVVPGSDGAGTVVAVGKHVKLFKEGDKVITLFNQTHLGGSIKTFDLQNGVGGSVDGTFRQYGAFNENGLVHMPTSLNFLEASTLTCAGLTAWNALYGLKQVSPGDWVLTQGTGGVSIFAVQFAKAAGARVVATTSSDQKASLLKKLGADHIVNYKTTPEWGDEAKKLTPDGRGFDHIVEVAGPTSMKQSLKAITPEGVITIIGFVGGPAKEQQEPGFLDCLNHLAIARGVLVGSRKQMQDMCRAIDANPETLRPIVDGKVFKLEELKEAYAHMESQKHQGNICIEIE